MRTCEHVILIYYMIIICNTFDSINGGSSGGANNDMITELMEKSFLLRTSFLRFIFLSIINHSILPFNVFQNKSQSFLNAWENINIYFGAVENIIVRWDVIGKCQQMFNVRINLVL